MACIINLRDHLSGSMPGGNWTWLGHTWGAVGTPSTGQGTNPGTLTGDNPPVNFSGVMAGVYWFEYCGQVGNCNEDCEVLKIQVVNAVACSPEPVDYNDTVCDTDLVSYNMYSLLGITEGSFCRITSAISSGPDTINSGDITVSGSTATVDLTSYPPGQYQLTVIIRTGQTLTYPLECEDCYFENTITFTVQGCEECEVNAGAALATQVCSDDGPQVILLKNRLSGADNGGDWTYLGWNETTPGSPGAGGSTIGSLAGDNPQLDFEGMIPGYYHFEYCVENLNLEDCADCEVLIIEVTECEDPCEEVSAGEAINTTICN